MSAVPHTPRHRAAGASLIELMVGLAVGLFVMAGVVAAYGNAGRSNRISDTLAVSQETARVLGQLIARDVMAAGYLGLAPGSTQVAGRRGSADALAVAAVADCAAGWYVDLDQALEGYDDVNPFPASCIPAAEYRPATDVLALRYVDDAQAPEPAPLGTVLLRAHRSGGALFVAGAAAPDFGPEAEDHELRARIYWIGRDAAGEPALNVSELAALGGKPRLVTTELASGVEDLQLEYGIDLDGDEVIDSFRRAGELAPWDSERVHAVKLWLVVKSAGEPVFDDKTYAYAGKAFTSNDRDYRYVYTTTIARRNRG